MEHKHGGNINKIKEDFNISPDEIMDFSVNTNFLGPPEEIYELLQKNTLHIKDYPEPNSKTMKKTIADKICLNDGNIIIGNGATEIIYQFVKIVNPTKALIISPTFSEYKFAVKSINGEIEHYLLTSENGFSFDEDRLLKKINQNQYDMVFICNPNNPTGKLILNDQIKNLLNVLKDSNTKLIVDESFIDFVQEKNKYTAVNFINQFENIFIIRSFTKIFSIPGIRLGYGIGSDDIINEIEKNRDPWSVNIFAQIIGEKLINYHQYYHQSREIIFRERDVLHNLLSQIDGIKPLYPGANFILLNISQTGKTSTEIARELGKEGIIIRNCNSFKSLEEDYIRVAVRGRSENMKLIKNLKKVCQR